MWWQALGAFGHWCTRCADSARGAWADSTVCDLARRNVQAERCSDGARLLRGWRTKRSAHAGVADAQETHTCAAPSTDAVGTMGRESTQSGDGPGLTDSLYRARARETRGENPLDRHRWCRVPARGPLAPAPVGRDAVREQVTARARGSMCVSRLRCQLRCQPRCPPASR